MWKYLNDAASSSAQIVFICPQRRNNFNVSADCEMFVQPTEPTQHQPPAPARHLHQLELNLQQKSAR